MTLRWNPRAWAGWMPNGLGQVKPNHYWEILQALWENRRELPFAWRILRRGVCDGCALGTTGLRDFTMEGIHLCTVRLKLLRLNTMEALDPAVLEDVSDLAGKGGRELRRLGRLPYPFLRRHGEKGFRRIAWDEALDLAARRIRDTDPQRLAFYLTSRGITNEVYYVAQKAARFLGTNNVDNSARICHAPSTNALKESLGVAASTCSYRDWIGTDLLVFVGSNAPNNQPVTTKYIYYAKQQGARVVVVNPHREPGLERYWVPSVFESAVFGTRLADDFFEIHTGGDIAFFSGVLKSLIESGGVDTTFVRERCEGFEPLQRRLEEISWERLEEASGTTRAEMRKLAQLLARARTGVFVWSMGVTQHRSGVDNVKSIIHLALARAMVGREKCGLMPIRGHSGVQGGAEVGCIPNALPGGRPLEPENLELFEKLWGFPVPPEAGFSAVDMIDAAHGGDLTVLFSAGGNFLETLPEPQYVREALNRIPLRIHQDIVVSPQMLVEPAEDVLLLPARTRYEQAGGGTETTTERQIIFSPEVPGRRIGESRSEWEILMQLAQRVYPARSHQIQFDDAAGIRREISRAVPFYAGIEGLSEQGDHVQWGGPRLCEGPRFGTATGKAQFQPLPLPEPPPTGSFLLSTRRGKQFNSMVQAARDPLTGADRDSVFMSPSDARELQVGEGDRVRIRSEAGELVGRIRLAPIRAGNLQVHWPEGNVLVPRGRVDPRCGIPDYNATVELTVLGRE